jgi:hypothetical protein
VLTSIRRGIRTAALGLLLVHPGSAADRDIRVLLLPPRVRGNVAQQRLDDFALAIARDGSPLVVVEHLDEADVIVELTDYSRRLNQKGTPEQRWVDSFKVVAGVHVERPTRRPAPEHFTLVVTGPDEWGQRRAVAVLADLLAKALGRQKPRATPEPT